MDFSVIIRAYNAEKYLKDAVNSVLNQRCGCRIEVLILYDEGSTDKTWIMIENIIKNTNIPHNIDLKVKRHPHMSPFRALQLGLKEAKGNYVTILDYDDIYPPSYLGTIYDVVNKHKDITFFFSRLLLVDKDGNIVSELKIPENPYDINRIIMAGFVGASAITLNKNCKNKIEELLNKLSHVYFDWIFEDWLIATLGLKFCKPLYIKDAYVLYRIHESNLTFSQRTYDDLKSIFNVEREIKTLIAMLYLFQDKKTVKRVLSSLAARYGIFLKRASKTAHISLPMTLLSAIYSITQYIIVTRLLKK